MDQATAAAYWHAIWGNTRVTIAESYPYGTSIRWIANPKAWPYKVQTPDRNDDEKTRWITSRIGPPWSISRDGGWYSVIAWGGDDTMLEFWFMDQEIFTEFSLKWC